MAWAGSIFGGLLAKPLEGWATKYWPVVLAIVGVALAAAVVPAVLSLSRGSGPAATPLPQVLDDLAKAVRGAWRKEAKNRGIYGRDVLMAGHWSPATGHAGAGSVSGPRRRRLDSAESIVRAFQDQPAPWLVVLGEPGAGKSTVALLLTLGLLDARAAEADAAEDGRSGAPVPVLFTIASWDPDREYLGTWLKRRLLEEHPFLRRLAGEEDRDGVLQSLLDDGRLLPVLDGMDEIKAELRPAAIKAIKESGLPRLILTCRAEEYDRAVADGQHMLPHTATLKLEPIRLADAIEFVGRGMPAREWARWGPLLEGLRRRPGGPLTKVFSTPLMISLARDVYKDRDTDPGELADEDRFPTEEVIAAHLLEGLIAAKFPRRPAGERQDWKGDDAKRWLTHLAVWMQRERVSEIAWWELSRLGPRPLRILIGLAGGLMAGSSAGLGFGVLAAHLAESAAVGWSVGGVLGLFLLAAMGRASARSTPKPSDLHFGVTRRRRAVLASGLVVGAIGGIAGFLLGGAGFAVVGSLSGVPIGLVYGLAAPDATEETVDPRRLLEQDRRVALIFGAVYGLTTAFVGGMGVNLVFGLGLAVTCSLAGGLLYGPVWVFALDEGKAGVISWMHLLFVRLWLSPRGLLPWRLLSFLEEAHRRGVLRQTGAVYQFRHAFLQEALAGVPPRPEDRTGR
jgi:MFS family permease